MKFYLFFRSLLLYKCGRDKEKPCLFYKLLLREKSYPVLEVKVRPDPENQYLERVDLTIKYEDKERYIYGLQKKGAREFWRNWRVWWDFHNGKPYLGCYNPNPEPPQTKPQKWMVET